ncbi:MAG: ZIP family metal transporter [Pirellulaceae bacterium]|nr:ZIP family metal transporter [Pirellulaceae bacterium]
MGFDSHAVVLLTFYSTAIVLSSLLGGWVPQFIRLTHMRIQTLISFVGGLMVGVAVFHLLPHAVYELGSVRIDEISWAMMLGMLIMFFMLRFFHFHQHESEELLANAGTQDHDHSHDQAAVHDHHCEHHHSHDHHHDRRHSLTWAGVLVGLGFHTLLDGVALASAVQAESHHAIGSNPFWGVGVFLAVLLHKPLDAMSITSLMRAQGATRMKAFAANIAFATMVPAGAFLVVFFGSLGGHMGSSIAGWGLAFSSGVFLCIALSDLLPEMEFHSHHRVQLTFALLLGAAVAWGIGFLEPKHLHNIQQNGNAAVSLPQHPSFNQQVEAVRRGLSREIQWDEAITDEQFSQLRGLADLETLYLNQARITDEASGTLQTLIGLRRLKLEKARLADKSAVAIGKLSKLTTINLPDSEIADLGIQSWTNLPELVLIRLGSPRLTDAALESVGSMKKLRFLHLIAIPVSDQGLASLYELKQLESFYLDGSKATDHGLSELLKKLPDLHFHRDQQHIPDDRLTDNHVNSDTSR